MLTDIEKKNFLNRFPDVELSYDNILHKKVYADLFMIIPKGQKAFLWITYYYGKNVSIIMHLNHRSNVIDLEICPMCFDNCLAYGTIIYGTLFKIGEKKCFCCEDLHMYKGMMVDRFALSKKLSLFKEMFKNYISQKTYNLSFILTGMAPCFPNKPAAESVIPSLPYPVYAIKLFDLKYGGKELGLHLIRQRFIPEGIFKVKATIQEDIYNIYCFDPHNPDKAYGLAMIPTYKRSVMMNNLFRTIKENGNLDLLEESDDEEEFENIKEDKFVNLKKIIVMKCVYSSRFNKWEPIAEIKEKIKLTTRKEAQLLEKKV